MTTYYDTFSGLVPCRLIRRFHSTAGGPAWGTLFPRCEVEVTANHGPYRKGEILEIPPNKFVHKTGRTECFTLVSTVAE